MAKRADAQVDVEVLKRQLEDAQRALAEVSVRARAKFNLELPYDLLEKAKVLAVKKNVSVTRLIVMLLDAATR